MTDEELLLLEQLVYEENCDKANDNLLDFTKFTFDGFVETNFHRTYYKILDLFAKGKIKNLMITVAPQHGKTEGSTRRLPAYMLGKDPNKRIAIGSYNQSLARKFNRQIQRIIDEKRYKDIFPNTKLAQSDTKGYVRNADEVEMVGSDG